MQLRWLTRAVGIGTAILLALWLVRHPLLEFLTFISHREAVIAYLDSFGVWGPLLLVSALSVYVVVALIPGQILMVAGGYLYGFSGGLLLNLIGTVGASQLTFLAARRVGRPIVQRLVPAHLLARWSQIVERQGFTFFLFFFWFPVIPGNVMNFVASLSPISFWLFLTASFLGRLPGIALITLIGSHGLELTPHQVGVLAVAGIGLFILGRYSTVKLQQHYLAP